MPICSKCGELVYAGDAGHFCLSAVAREMIASGGWTEEEAVVFVPSRPPVVRGVAKTPPDATPSDMKGILASVPIPRIPYIAVTGDPVSVCCPVHRRVWADGDDARRCGGGTRAPMAGKIKAVDCHEREVWVSVRGIEGESLCCVMPLDWQ